MRFHHSPLLLIVHCIGCAVFVRVRLFAAVSRFSVSVVRSRVLWMFSPCASRLPVAHLAVRIRWRGLLPCGAWLTVSGSCAFGVALLRSSECHRHAAFAARSGRHRVAVVVSALTSVSISERRASGSIDCAGQIGRSDRNSDGECSCRSCCPLRSPPPQTRASAERAREADPDGPFAVVQAGR